MRKAFENPDGAADEDLKAFIASSSGEDDNDQENTNQPFESLVAPAADSRFRQWLNFSFFTTLQVSFHQAKPRLAARLL